MTKAYKEMSRLSVFSAENQRAGSPLLGFLLRSGPQAWCTTWGTEHTCWSHTPCSSQYATVFLKSANTNVSKQCICTYVYYKAVI